jgi:hypothetical protein
VVLAAPLWSMPSELGEGGGQVALGDAAETGKAARAVDKYLIPDAARVSVDHAVLREIEGSREIGNDILGIVRDAFALVMIDDGDDVAVDRAAVNGAVACDA